MALVIDVAHAARAGCIETAKPCSAAGRGLPVAGAER
jgi:hypothetical protein